MSGSPALDPIIARRARVALGVRIGKSIGYACFGLAVVLFVVGYAVGFTDALSAIVVALLLLGCVALPPAIVFGYGLRAAERHERQEAAQRQRPAAGRTPPGDPPTPPEPPPR